MIFDPNEPISDRYTLAPLPEDAPQTLHQDSISVEIHDEESVNITTTEDGRIRISLEKTIEDLNGAALGVEIAAVIMEPWLVDDLATQLKSLAWNLQGKLNSRTNRLYQKFGYSARNVPEEAIG